MLSDDAAATPFGATFQIIKAVLQSDGVKVRLGGGGDAPMLGWSTVSELTDLKQAARLYETAEAPDGSIHKGGMAWGAAAEELAGGSARRRANAVPDPGGGCDRASSVFKD